MAAVPSDLPAISPTSSQPISTQVSPPAPTTPTPVLYKSSSTYLNSDCVVEESVPNIGACVNLLVVPYLAECDMSCALVGPDSGSPHSPPWSLGSGCAAEALLAGPDGSPLLAQDVHQPPEVHPAAPSLHGKLRK